MDIESLWALGGWFLLQNCMAAPKTSSSSSPSIFENQITKSNTFLLVVALVFIFLLLSTTRTPISNPRDPYYYNSMASTLNSRRRLLMDSSGSTATVSTTNLHPKKAQKPHSSPSTRTKFGAEAHEVPSGPNPISN
ncbi:hypothetical protein L484_015208 [Morus notabilis]|uniref:CLAVATA3/ESR (CLE)-related protein 44 n=1 Tax=Morus notabilis TaxID=981085 RepID=W9S349_9ROSA|nr:hypothetical protein L484_015208 [Morus notabilis]